MWKLVSFAKVFSFTVRTVNPSLRFQDKVYNEMAFFATVYQLRLKSPKWDTLRCRVPHLEMKTARGSLN